MEILIVKYLPSGPVSNTLKLLEYVKGKLGENHKLSELDLIKQPPSFYDESSMYAYRRISEVEKLDEKYQQAIQPYIELSDQFTAADLIILATPFHNYSLPGVVKSYMDAVMLKGKVVEYKDGKRHPLMVGKKFLTLYSSGGDYRFKDTYLDNLKTLMDILLDFMGIEDMEYVNISTGKSSKMEEQYQRAFSDLDRIAETWNL